LNCPCECDSHDALRGRKVRDGRLAGGVLMDNERKLKGDLRDGKKIHDLVDVVDEETREAVPGRDLTIQRDEMVAKEIRDVTERIARALIPGIVERVVREEIEKLKKVDS